MFLTCVFKRWFLHLRLIGFSQYLEEGVYDKIHDNVESKCHSETLFSFKDVGTLLSNYLNTFFINKC